MLASLIRTPLPRPPTQLSDRLTSDIAPFSSKIMHQSWSEPSIDRHRARKAAMLQTMKAVPRLRPSGSESGPAPPLAHLGATVPRDVEWYEDAPRPMITSKLPKVTRTTFCAVYQCAVPTLVLSRTKLVSYVTVLRSAIPIRCRSPLLYAEMYCD